MKVGLVVPANIYFSPYINIYIKILREINVRYDIIFWDRELIGEEGGIAYRRSSSSKLLKIDKISGYLGFAKFAKSVIKQNRYERLIIFGPQAAIFLYSYLKREYPGNFILDYRDLSFEQKLKPLFRRLLKICSLRVISSEGFLKVLPDEFRYLISHNFDIEQINKTDMARVQLKTKKTISVLTIGAIRDYGANKEIIDALKHDPFFFVRFIGKGPSSDLLEKYVLSNDIKNVSFQGFYKKEEEPLLVGSADFMNIYYPLIVSHSTAMSNRFYSALIHKVPMIVRSGSIQGDYVEKYNLGISVKDCSNLSTDLKIFIDNFDEQGFVANCNLLLAGFLDDYSIFRNAVLSYIR